MSISKEEIIDLALRYISEDEITPFPDAGDFFAIFYKPLSGTEKIQREDKKVNFLFYGLCLDYFIDEQEKPYGKWILMSFLNFGHFPPIREAFKLQPPHIAKGKFQNSERTMEFYFFKIPIRGKIYTVEEELEDKDKKKMRASKKKTKKVDNIVKFEKKK
ncbi:MAG: hypothetical protein N2053_08050 [Chitinispirillaceae bacterium]|nr:hypothetical protein [Chitinispirillaceae bacterium]